MMVNSVVISCYFLLVWFIVYLFICDLIDFDLGVDLVAVALLVCLLIDFVVCLLLCWLLRLVVYEVL